MMKVGKNSKDIFAPTVPAPTSKPLATPVKTPEPYTKATVVLRNSQIAYLDQLALDIRSKSGAAIARAELIRAMIDAIAESGVDFSSITSEDDARQLLTEHLAGKTSGRKAALTS